MNSLSEGMIAMGRLGAQRLGDAKERTIHFLSSHRQSDGGFRGRAGTSDLYYSAFAVGCFTCLGAEIAPMPVFLQRFADGSSLDLVHRSCLARLCTLVPGADPEGKIRQAIKDRFLHDRAKDGGWARSAQAQRGSVYGAFLALGALEDCGERLDEYKTVVSNLELCRAQSGGYADQPGEPHGLTPLSAGVLVLKSHLGLPIASEDLDWLAGRCHTQGGFFAATQVPMPDLLSTATALEALGRCNRITPEIAGKTLRFLDLVWNEDHGTFRGHPLDPALDAEYLWYGLLALGRLSQVQV